jgi:hypothetical protein
MTQLSHVEVCRRAFLITLLLAAFTAQAAGLPDTGQITCYNDAGPDAVAASDPASIARDAGSHPRQDCRYGRDPAAAAGALTKTGAGAKGLDYSKIANDGSTLAANAALGGNPTDWACTRDNITGLTWEVKTTSGLRDMASTYTWYSTNGTTNGGNAGDNTDTTTCNSTLASCNTQAYVTAVNAGNGLCNASDWRLPTLRELLTLVLADGSSPSIDPAYFPNTQGAFWSGSTYVVPDPSDAWLVGFNGGSAGAAGKSSYYTVRLVRGGQF